MPTTSEFGYTPICHMPIIPAPTDESIDPTTYYNSLGINITPENLGVDGLKFEVTGLTSPQLYTMTGGVVHYIPGGDLLPDGITTSPGEGSVVLKTHTIDITDLNDKLPGGIPVMAYSMYLNIKESTVRTALTPFLDSLPTKILDLAWSEVESTDPSTIDIVTKKASFLDQVMIGQKELFVEGGTTIGDIDLNTVSNTEFTLRFALHAVDTGSIFPISPLLFLQLFPNFAGSVWTNHPLITATNSLPVPVDMYIKFEVWNPGGGYLPVDAGLEVQLMNYNPSPLFDNILSSSFTDVNGVAHFSYTDQTEYPWPFTSPPDIYFKVINPVCSGLSFTLPSGVSIPPFTLPSEWQTKTIANGTANWQSVSGADGYYDNFIGTQLGSLTNPLTFRIGIDFHLEIEYVHPKKTITESLLKGVLINLNTSTSSPKSEEEAVLSSYVEKVSTRMVASNGKLDGIFFDIQPEEDIFFQVLFNMEDTDFNIQNTTIDDNSNFAASNNYTGAWFSSINQLGQKLFDNIRVNSIGSFLVPEYLLIQNPNAQVAIYALKLWRELSSFLWYMTDKDWEGLELKIHLYGPGDFLAPLGITMSQLAPFSAPIGHIYMTLNKTFWTRDTFIHEMSHQLMWVESNYNSYSDIILGFLADIINSGSYHYDNLLSNPRRALTEGWARGIEAIFENKPISDSTFTNMAVGATGVFTTLGPTMFIPINEGEKSEGAFANTIYYIFWNQVVQGITSISALKESTNGDIAQSNPWIATNQPSLSNEFKALIWEPLKALNAAGLTNIPESTDMLNYMLQSDILRKHKLFMEMQRWNIRVFTPIITSLSSTSGSASGGNIMQINGDNFTDTYTASTHHANVYLEVYFGTQTANNVIVISSTNLSCMVPPGSSATTVPVQIVLNVRGHSIPSNTTNYTYV